MAISHHYWHCYWNFNHEGSYLPDVICNIVVKAHFGRSSLQMKSSTRSDIPPTTCQMKWPRSDVSSNFQMKYPNKLSDLSPQDLSVEVTKITCEFKFSDEVPRYAARFPPPKIARWSDQDEVHTEIIYEFIFQMTWPDNLSAHSLSLSPSLALSLLLALSMQSPIDREICRSHNTHIVQFLCFHCSMDGHSLSLSLTLLLSLSIQSPIDREISRSHIMDIVPFLCFHCFTEGHSLSLPCSLSCSWSISLSLILSLYAIYW